MFHWNVQFIETWSLYLIYSPNFEQNIQMNFQKSSLTLNLNWISGVAANFWLGKYSHKSGHNGLCSYI